MAASWQTDAYLTDHNLMSCVLHTIISVPGGFSSDTTLECNKHEAENNFRGELVTNMRQRTTFCSILTKNGRKLFSASHSLHKVVLCFTFVTVKSEKLFSASCSLHKIVLCLVFVAGRFGSCSQPHVCCSKKTKQRICARLAASRQINRNAAQAANISTIAGAFSSTNRLMQSVISSSE